MWLAAVAAVVAHLVLARTTFGRHVYLLGTTLLGLILNGLILLGISAYWQQVFSGAVIILAVALNLWRQQHRR